MRNVRVLAASFPTAILLLPLQPDCVSSFRLRTTATISCRQVDELFTDLDGIRSNSASTWRETSRPLAVQSRAPRPARGAGTLNSERIIPRDSP